MDKMLAWQLSLHPFMGICDTKGREQVRGNAEAYTDTAKRCEKIREAPKSAASMTELQTTAQPF